MARRAPDVLVIGADTNASVLVEVSRKAPCNALFVVADALETLHVLRNHLTEVRITLPWGSLLRSVLDGERAFALAVAGAL